MVLLVHKSIKYTTTKALCNSFNTMEKNIVEIAIKKFLISISLKLSDVCMQYTFQTRLFT